MLLLSKRRNGSSNRVCEFFCATYDSEINDLTFGVSQLPTKIQPLSIKLLGSGGRLHLPSSHLYTLDFDPPRLG